MYVQYLFIYDVYIYIYLSVASQINTSLRTLFIAKFVVQQKHALYRRLYVRIFSLSLSKQIATHFACIIYLSLILLPISSLFYLFKNLQNLFAQLLIQLNAALKTKSKNIFYYYNTIALYVILFSMLLSSLVLHVRVLSVRI